MIEYEYARLRGKIAERFSTKQDFAEALGIFPSTLSNKLTGRSWFTQEEITKAIEILELTPEEAVACFFTPKVQGA